MNKIFSKFAIGLASFALIAGASAAIINNTSKEVRAEEVNTETLDVTFTFDHGYPGGWHRSIDEWSDTSEIVQTVDGVSYSFSTNRVNWQDGYLRMEGSSTNPSWIGLPARPYKKLTKVAFHTNQYSTSSGKIGVNDDHDKTNFPNSLNAYAEGVGKDVDVVFNLENTDYNTRYYLVIVSSSMVRLNSLTLTYEWTPVTSIDFGTDEMNMDLYSHQTLTPTISPTSYSEKILWYSDDTSVATVDNTGRIDCLKTGTTIIYCYADSNESGARNNGEVYGSVILHVVEPSGQYVYADRTNINSYTGLTEKVRVNFGNLTDDFRFETENADLIHIDEIFSSKLSIFNITCLKAGIAEISLLDGDFVMETITLNITQSEIAITGLPSSETMFTETSLDLGSFITVSATGCYSELVEWTSSDESVATVDDNGVVVALKEGATTIKVESAGNDEVYQTCSITVDNTLTAFFSNGTYIYRTMPTTSEQYIRSIEGYSISNELTFSNLNRFGVGENTPVVLSINDEQGNGHFTLGIKNGTIDNKPAHFTEVTIRCKALYESQVVPFSINGVEKSATGEGYNNYTVELTKRNVKEVTFVNLSDEGISLVISSVTFKFDYDVDAKTAVRELNTQTSIAYRYEKAGEDYFISDKTIRFGGVVDKGLWNELDTTYGIVSFGVLICETELFENPVISDNFMFVIDAESNDVADELGGGIQRIIDFSVNIDDMEETIGDDGDNYFWNLRFNIPTDRYYYGMDTKFTAAAYIAINDGNDKEYILMNQVTESFLSIAQDYIDHRGCDKTTAGGSLWYLSQYYKNMGL